MYLKVGKIINYHGLKGEVKVQTSFSEPLVILKENNQLYVGDNKKELTINHYRPFKKNHLITFKDHYSINDINDYLNQEIYIKEVVNDNNLIDLLIGYNVYYNNQLIGEIINFFKSGPNTYVLEVETNTKVILIAYHQDLIKDINHDHKTITILGGLIDEN